jgi:hypothetical protein
MSEFNYPEFQQQMREVAESLCRAANFAISASGMTTTWAAGHMARFAEEHMASAHAKLMAAKSLIDGAPAAAKAVEIRGGEEIPLGEMEHPAYSTPPDDIPF